MTLQQLENELKAVLKDCDQPAFEVRQILTHLLGKSTIELLLAEAEAVDSNRAEEARCWAARRSEGYPLAYLTGKKGFYKHEFQVAPGVLIPRPETEHAVEVALERTRGEQVTAIADLGCGTGCLGLSVVAELPTPILFSIDRAELAVRLAQINARALGLADRVRVVQVAVEDWSPPGPLDLVVANPPYIAENDSQVQASVHRFEPHVALYSGLDGLDAIRAWSAWSRRFLRSGGVFVCEIGSGQSRSVREIMANQGFEQIQIQKDLAGHDRVASAVRRED
jgi:release factor glutamine methyltransferase